MLHMDSIGVRELRQNASEWLRRVEAGETIEIKNRGRVVALLKPPPKRSRLEELEALGLLSRATGSLSDLGPPLPLKPGVPSPSEVLEQMRAHER